MVFTAYYDASSKEEEVNKPLVVAGVAATEDRWTQFESDWKRVLDNYDVEFLDMAKCAQWQGYPYNTWNRSENIRRPFLCGLAEALTNAATQVVVVRILPADFNAVNMRYRLGDEFLPSAYPMAVFKCMGLVEELCNRAAPDEMAHVIESGDSGQGALVALEAKGFPIAIRPKQDKRTGRWFHPFGACDMVAYEYRKAAEKKLALGTHRFALRALLRTLRKIPTRSVYIDQAGLTAACEAFPNKYPRRAQ